MDSTDTFTSAVRQELVSRPLGEDAERWAELAAIVRCAGRLVRRGGDPGTALTVVTTSGAVARRTYALLQERGASRPELVVRAPGGVQRRTTYEIRLGPEAAPAVARELRVLDRGGRLVTDLPVMPGEREAIPFLRGAVLACASFSAPQRPPHLELAPGSAAVAQGLAALLDPEVNGNVAVASGRDRVVVKSGEAIGEILVLVGATSAFLRWDEQRMRRQLRGEANRLANADAANLRRTIEAASAQVRAVEQVLAELGWDALDDELREVALARLANPGASLQEVGQLLDPPVGKSAVHRRLRRLVDLPTEHGSDG